MQHQSVALELPSCSHLQRRRRAERPSVSSTNTGDQPVLPEFQQGQSNDPGPWPCITVDPETQVRRALFTATNAEHMPSLLLLVCQWPRQPDRAQQHICAPGWGQPLAVGYEGTSNNVTSIMSIGACCLCVQLLQVLPIHPQRCFLSADGEQLLHVLLGQHVHCTLASST